MAGENAQSRIYLGIHFEFDAVEGIRCGDSIGDYVFTHALLPLHGGRPGTLPSLDPSAQIQLAVALENVAATGGLKGTPCHAPPSVYALRALSLEPLQFVAGGPDANHSAAASRDGFWAATDWADVLNS
jgi:hypothetical protein